MVEMTSPGPGRLEKLRQANSLMSTLQQTLLAFAPLGDNGQPTLTPELQQAHIRVSEAAFWLTQSVLMHGPDAADADKGTQEVPADGT